MESAISGTHQSQLTVFSFAGQVYKLSKDHLKLTSISSTVVILLSTIVVALKRKSEAAKAAYDIPGWLFIGCRNFFYDNHGFLQEGFERFGDVFSFKFVSNNVLAIKGAEARRLFMYDKNLSFSKGHAAMQNVNPAQAVKEAMENRIANEPDNDLGWFHKRNAAVTRKELLVHLLPLMLKDLEACTNSWGSEGRYNPWTEHYPIITQLLMRTTTTKEIADSPETVKHISQLLQQLDKATTFETSFYPWLPTLTRIQKFSSVARLYIKFKKAAEARVVSGEAVEDPVQVLVDRGDKPVLISQFILLSLFAGLLNVVKMSCWVPVFLAHNPKWKASLTQEFQSLLDKYPNPQDTSGSSSSTLAEKLSQIPLEAWEDNLPTFDYCLRETIRIILTGALFRKNIGEQSIWYNGKEIKQGDCVVTSVCDSHLDPSTFPNPEIWDPSRFQKGEDKKEPYAFIGWGLGRHVCPGMRVAQLQIKLLTAFLLLRYDYSIEDSCGAPFKVLPEPNRKILQFIPPAQPIFIKYKRIMN